MILAWLRRNSLWATKNKRLFIFAQSEMLSRNNRLFLDMCLISIVHLPSVVINIAKSTVYKFLLEDLANYLPCTLLVSLQGSSLLI